MQDKCKNAQLGYVPIFLRIWWCKEARELGRRLDFMILSELARDEGIRVKAFPVCSLYRCYNPKHLKNKDIDDVNPAFLESDDVHMNKHGYTGFFSDITLRVMDQRRREHETSNSNNIVKVS